MTVEAMITAATSLANVGALIYLGKRALDKIDAHSQAIAPMVESMKTINRSLKELFESRNDHERRLTETETVRRLHGCDDPERRREWPTQK